MGGCIRISTFPGRSLVDPDGRIALVPLMVTGRIGRFKSNAKRKAPFLNGSISWTRLLVPSGKKTTEVPFLIFDLAAFIDAKAAFVLDRSMKICPTAMLPNPIPGIFLISFFITHLKSMPSLAYNTSMS